MLKENEKRKKNAALFTNHSFPHSVRLWITLMWPCLKMMGHLVFHLTSSSPHGPVGGAPGSEPQVAKLLLKCYYIKKVQLTGLTNMYISGLVSFKTNNF